MIRDSMVFYRSFYEATKCLPAEQYKATVTAILEYALNGTAPAEDNGIGYTVYCMAKPQIDANNVRYQNGTKGGKKKTEPEPNQNRTGTKPEPNRIQEGTKAEPNVNDNVYVNDNVNENQKQIMCKANDLFERLWALYPNKRGKGQVSDTQKKRLLAIGEPALVKAIERYSAALQQDADWRKPQNGSTFFNSGYVDYLDENYSPGKGPSKKSAKNGFCNFEQRDTDYNALVMDSVNQWLHEEESGERADGDNKGAD